MGLSVTSAFIEKIQASVVNSIFTKFTFNSSVMTDRVVGYGTITHDVTDLVGGVFTVTVENASQTFNSFISDKLQFFQEGIFEYGFITAEGSQDTVQLFGGDLTKASFREGRVNLTFKDKLARLKVKTVGSDETPVTFTGSNYNPADLAWFVQTSYGGLSTVKSDSNPDVDYPTWLTWHTQFADDNVVVQGNFTGEDVLTILQTIAKLTDSVIFDEGDNRLDYARFTGVTTFTHTVTDSFITGRIDLDVDGGDIVNKAQVLFNYDVTSKTWGATATHQNTSSVNSYGLQELVFDDTSVWYVDSISAGVQSERVVFRRKEPNMKIKIPTGLRYLDAVVGDMVSLTTKVYSLSEQLLTVTGYTINTDNNEMNLRVDEGFGRATGKLQAFILDDPVYGLLDSSINPLF